MAKKTRSLNCTSAFMAGGKMILPGKQVHGVPESSAKDLVRRGKATFIDASGADSDDEGKALTDMTVSELKAEAKELEIEGADGMKKPELIAAIEAAEGDGE